MPYRTKAQVVSPSVATFDMPALGLSTVLRNRNYFLLFRSRLLTSPGSATLDCVWAEIYRIVCQKSALSPGDMEETIRPSGLEAINVKEGRAHLFSMLSCGSPDPDFFLPDPGLKRHRIRSKEF